MLNNYIELKRRCELIVTETDLTNVLTVLNSEGCTKVEVSIHWNANERANTLWRVAFKTTEWVWASICEESKEVCSNAILMPLKDSFGKIIYHEA